MDQTEALTNNLVIRKTYPFGVFSFAVEKTSHGTSLLHNGTVALHLIG